MHQWQLKNALADWVKFNSLRHLERKLQVPGGCQKVRRSRDGHLPDHRSVGEEGHCHGDVYHFRIGQRGRFEIQLICKREPYRSLFHSMSRPTNIPNGVALALVPSRLRRICATSPRSSWKLARPLSVYKLALTREPPKPALTWGPLVKSCWANKRCASSLLSLFFLNIFCLFPLFYFCKLNILSGLFHSRCANLMDLPL